MPEPTPPPPETTSRRGGARPGAGRKRGPSRLTADCQRYLDAWLGSRPELFADLSRVDILKAAARRCFIQRNDPMAARFLSAAWSADRTARRHAAELEARLAAVDPGAPLTPALRAELEAALAVQAGRTLP